MTYEEARDIVKRFNSTRYNAECFKELWNEYKEAEKAFGIVEMSLCESCEHYRDCPIENEDSIVHCNFFEEEESEDECDEEEP